MVQKAKTKKPFWKGPIKDGLTQSLFGRWLCCRERFRLLVVEGVKEDEGFRHGMEYGNYWHEAEQAFCGGKEWKPVIKKYCQQLRQLHPADEASVLKWYKVCLAQFPAYINHWKKHPDTCKRKYLMEEVSFSEIYKLPSGRKIRLRGKWDTVYQQGKQGHVWLQENKTKGSIDELGITQTLDQNLQTMWYLIALKCFARRLAKEGPNSWKNHKHLKGPIDPAKIKGVMYNVIRRPLAQNAKYSIRQRQKESEKQFYKRLGKTFTEDPKYFFMRWESRIRKEDYQRFKKEVFHPLLESFLDWWESIQGVVHKEWETFADLQAIYRKGKPKDLIVATPFNPWASPLHYRFPFGVWNSLWDGWRGDYFDLLTTGRKSGLIKIKTLYPELD